LQIHIKKGFLNYIIIEGKRFSERLINWYTGRKRDLPWRQTKDPYAIWLSEIILQQTRVDQGLPYWERFMEAYPTVTDLANASQEHVLRLWQGLGYYSRARNLHATAKIVTNDFEGIFPDSTEGLLKLKGIGPYTAAAIASICFNEPTPVVDGNVFRFASRYFGIEADISKASSRKVFTEILVKEIDEDRPGEFNQAMMEYGATVCSPNPSCSECTFNVNCWAFQHDRQKSLPVKSGKTKVRTRHFHYVALRYKNRYFLNERKSKDVWSGLYDFLLFEGDENEESIAQKIQHDHQLKGFVIDDVSETILHILSHQKIEATFYLIDLESITKDFQIQNTSLRPYSIEEMLNLPKPKLIVNYLARLGIN